MGVDVVILVLIECLVHTENTNCSSTSFIVGMFAVQGQLARLVQPGRVARAVTPGLLDNLVYQGPMDFPD